MSKVSDAPERPKHGPQVRGHGPGAMGPQEKAINFLPSLKRLLGTLRPERTKIILVVALTVVAVFGVLAVAATSTGWALLGLTMLVLLGPACARVVGGVNGRDLIAVLRDSALAELVCALGLLVGLVIG